MTRKPKPPSPGNGAPDIEAMIRVDHAGEYGAVRIYEGQLAVLRRRQGTERSVATIAHMAEQEQRHLKTFDKMINERRVRPTALEPVWRIAGFALGAATAAMGEKAAFACTAAVEEVIDEHYAAQIAALEDGTIVAARQGNWLATSFHPELTSDTRFHAWFLEIARANRGRNSG